MKAGVDSGPDCFGIFGLRRKDEAADRCDMRGSTVSALWVEDRGCGWSWEEVCDAGAASGSDD